MWRKLLSRAFAFGDNISLDKWLKAITFVANGNCYIRLRKKQSTCFGSNSGMQSKTNQIYELMLTFDVFYRVVQ